MSMIMRHLNFEVDERKKSGLRRHFSINITDVIITKYTTNNVGGAVF